MKFMKFMLRKFEMDAATIIREFTTKGVHLTPTDHGTIKVTPSNALTDADRDLLRRHKADLLAELGGMNIMNLMNIDSGHWAPARIVHAQEPKFIGPQIVKTPPALDPEAFGNHWEIALSDGRVVEVAISPPATRAQVIEDWKAVEAVCLPDILQIKEPDRGSLHGA